MLLLFLLQAALLGLIGIEAPLVFALFCAITDIIPYVGPWIGAIPVIIVGFLQGPLTGFLTGAAVVLAQNIESYYLQPVVMGKTMKLHPVTIMLGLLIFEHFFGIIGMILATPIISVMKVLLDYFEEKYHFINKLQNN
jgi:predicted PurR-regulated permease PerM